MVTCPTTSHFCPCGLDICPPYLGFPLRRTDLPQVLDHDMDRLSLPWKIIFWLSTSVVLSVSLQEFRVVQERFIPPLLPNLVLPELAERWRFSPPSRDISAYKLVVLWQACCTNIPDSFLAMNIFLYVLKASRAQTLFLEMNPCSGHRNIGRADRNLIYNGQKSAGARARMLK